VRAFDLESQRSTAVLDRVEIPLPSAARSEQGLPLGSLFAPGLPVFVLEPEKAEERLRVYGRELRIASGITAAARAFLRERPGCDLSRTKGGDGDGGYTVLSAQGVSLAKDSSQAQTDLKASVDSFLKRCREVHILCKVKAEADRLRDLLKEQAIRTNRAVKVKLGRVSEGFQFPALDLCVINHHELFQRLPVRRDRRRRALRSRALESFQELKPGDLVVHLVHGIARFEGLVRMERESGGEEDFMVLVFRDEVSLYVPASKIHLVHRYVGSGRGAPRLDRIGGSEWSRRRERVEGALRDLAAELLDIQALREEERGFAFQPDDDLQQTFDASFPYEETEDQIESMSAIKADMVQRKPMDRLLCGDVGFGKTELALRGAFKAVSSGKQAAVLVPTTILAQQHYETFRTRLADYPVTVEVLSRFQKRMRQEEIVRETREGRVDILIGTHRLLSRDVGFKDLGLLVIDEEQRFGVRHKELLKRMKRTVDVLTMTATPIPRTLHMALVGIRDISSLEIPPEGRMPIHTMVEVRSDALIRRALLLEVSRGGQVFFLHNRVESIAAQTEMLKDLVPGVRIAFAHGQMPERELQRVITRFIRRELDVLVCTTIIESGIDMPAVNTIIIDRADTFGLADLHQLRGRVGRGAIKAYCYLLIPHRHVSHIALRRLKAIEELSQLGAGFKIALKDLEIRGAGNILGVEQHGHITAVGYDLYCRLLKATVLEMKGGNGGEETVPIDVDLDIQVKAFIPPDFIPDEGTRVEILRRLSECLTAQCFRIMEDELEDRFGRIRPEVARLIDVFRIRRRMLACGIQRLTRARGSREVFIGLFDTERYGREMPLRHAKINTMTPTRAVLILPAGTSAPDDVLGFLKSQLKPAGVP